MGKVVIKDLRIHCIIGTYESERKIMQDLFLDIELGFDFQQFATVDSVSATIDYTEIEKLLQNYIQDSKFNLIETVAERSCKLILDNWSQIKECTVCVKKPNGLPTAQYVSAIAHHY